MLCLQIGDPMFIQSDAERVDYHQCKHAKDEEFDSIVVVHVHAGIIA